jgi:hypothetical protein
MGGNRLSADDTARLLVIGLVLLRFPDEAVLLGESEQPVYGVEGLSERKMRDSVDTFGASRYRAKYPMRALRLQMLSANRFGREPDRLVDLR